MLFVLLLACHPPEEPKSGDSSPPTQDSATDSSTTDPFCAEAPLVNYNNFGQGFMTENCQGCHASTTHDRFGAPEDVTFDTVEQVWLWASSILSTSTGDAPTMPPSGGVEEDERTKLEWWLRCATPGT